MRTPASASKPRRAYSKRCNMAGVVTCRAPPDTAAVDAFADVTGTLSATDAEGTTPAFGIQGVTPASGSSVLAGAYGTLTVVSGGGWTYVPDAAAQRMAEAVFEEITGASAAAG